MIIKKDSQKFREVKRNNTETASPAALPQDDVMLTEEQNIESSDDNEEEEDDDETPAQAENLPKEPDIDLFDIENIDFEQRQERRRGSRRRGYRRIDDRNLVSRAQEEAEAIKKSAFDEGYRKGLEQAEADMDKFRKDIVTFMNATKNVFEYVAPDILEISVDIARKIIKKELETDPQVLINTIIEVLKTLAKNEPKINIRVRPQAVQFIKDTLPNITYQYGIDAKINIVADPSIEEGGCVFQTNNGIVDASLDTQLEIIKNALEGM